MALTKHPIIFLTTGLITLIINQTAFAQKTTETFQKKADSLIRAEFPQTRTFNIEYENAMSRDFDSELFGDNFQEGEIKSQQKVTFNANIPFYKYKKWVFSASGMYTFNQFEFDNLQNVSNTVLFEQNGTVTFHNFSTSLNTTLFSTLFKKPLIYNGSIVVDGNDKGFERVKGLVGASIVLKRNANTTITTGLLVIIDPTAQIPFFPTFTYNHKFKNSPWEFDFILPQRILFRRPITNKSRISIGSTFGASGFYVNVNSPNLPDVFEYSQLEIKSGLIYEQILSKNLILTAKGGVLNFVSNRLTEKGEPTQDFIYENNQNMTGYFNIGLSFNPFTKK